MVVAAASGDFSVKHSVLIFCVGDKMVSCRRNYLDLMDHLTILNTDQWPFLDVYLNFEDQLMEIQAPFNLNSVIVTG